VYEYNRQLDRNELTRKVSQEMRVLRRTDVWALPTMMFKKYRTSKYLPAHVNYDINRVSRTAYRISPCHDPEEARDHRCGYVCDEKEHHASQQSPVS
jgi:hypothetical protein